MKSLISETLLLIASVILVIVAFFFFLLDIAASVQGVAVFLAR